MCVCVCVLGCVDRLLVQLLILGLSLKYTFPFFGLRTDSEMRYENDKVPKKDPARHQGARARPVLVGQRDVLACLSGCTAIQALCDI